MPRDDSGPAAALPAAVKRALEKAFPGVDLAELCPLLPGASEIRAEDEAGYQRVLLAIVKLAEGDVARLARTAEAARKDWRDVLYWAEYPRDARGASSWEELQAQLGLKDPKA